MVCFERDWPQTSPSCNFICGHWKGGSKTLYRTCLVTMRRNERVYGHALLCGLFAILCWGHHKKANGTEGESQKRKCQIESGDEANFGSNSAAEKQKYRN
jgi:hypothetical protein